MVGLTGRASGTKRNHAKFVARALVQRLVSSTASGDYQFFVVATVTHLASSLRIVSRLMAGSLSFFFD